MKKEILYLLVVALCSTGAVFSGCNSFSDKSKEAKMKEVYIEQSLIDAKRSASEEDRKNAKDQDWTSFKAEAESKIQANETTIADMQAKAKANKNVFNLVYTKELESIATTNGNLRRRLLDYIKDDANWEAFKREFNQDADKIAAQLNKITTQDNTKKNQF